MKNSQPLSWKAEKKGLVYCAPACGSGCLRSEFEDATAKAKKLAKLLGKHFTPRVWENMGWYWEVRAGNITVGEERYGTKGYYANYDNKKWVNNAPTAKKALKLLEQELVKDLADKQARVDEIRSLYW